MFRDKFGNLRITGVVLIGVAFFAIAIIVNFFFKGGVDLKKLQSFNWGSTTKTSTNSGQANSYSAENFQGIDGGIYQLKSEIVRSLYDKDWNNLKFDVNRSSLLTLKNGEISYGNVKKSVKEILKTNCSSSPTTISPRILCFFETTPEDNKPFRSRRLYFTININENTLNLINYDMLNTTVDTRDCKFTSAGDIACVNVNYNYANVFVYKKDGSGVNYKGMDLMDKNPSLMMVRDFIVLTNSSGTYDRDGLYKIQISTNYGTFQYSFTSSGAINTILDRYLVVNNKCSKFEGDCIQVIDFSGSNPFVRYEYPIGVCKGTPVVYGSYDNIFVSQCNHAFSINIRNLGDYKEYDFSNILEGYSAVKLFGVQDNKLLVTTNVPEGSLTLPTARDYIYIVDNDKLNCIKDHCAYNKSSLSIQPLVKTYSTDIKDFIFGAVSEQNKLFIYDIKLDRVSYIENINNSSIIGVDSKGKKILVASDKGYDIIDLNKSEVVMKDIPKGDIQFTQL